MTGPEPWQPEGYYAPKETTVAAALAAYRRGLKTAKATLAQAKKEALAASRPVKNAQAEVDRLTTVIAVLEGAADLPESAG